MALRLLAAAMVLAAAPAGVGESPSPSAKLACVDASGAVLPLRDGTYADLLAAYEAKAGWRARLLEAGPGGYRVVFSASAAAGPAESATFELRTAGGLLAVTSIDYASDGQREHLEKGLICLRLINLLAP